METKPKVGRPQIDFRKIRVNLTIDKDILKKGKAVANLEKKSLSQYTQDEWEKSYKNMKFIGNLSYEEALEKIQEELDEVKQKVKEAKKK